MTREEARQVEIWGKSFPGSGNGQCKGPELGISWLVSETAKKPLSLEHEGESDVEGGWQRPFLLGLCRQWCEYGSPSRCTWAFLERVK